MITKVLVAFDGTESANHALEFGINLADKYYASLLIINVLELPFYGGSEDATLSAGVVDFTKDLRKLHQDMLEGAAKKVKHLKPNLIVTTELREGNPAMQVVEAAEEGKFDVIVVGHGRESKLRELFLGSTSERVAHMAKCAVLIVK